MKISICSLIIFLLAGLPAWAQMTVEQRVFDFQVLASLFAKRYAPMNWKREAVNFDGLNVTPWLPRVRAAKDDTEFLEICKEYVSGYDDVHTSFFGPGNLIVDSGLSTDLYDGKVLIEFVNRTLLPRARYPIEVGDQVISVDGRPVDQVVGDFMRLQKMANPTTTRRYAVETLMFRYAPEQPRTALLGENLELQLKQADGETRSFTIPWVKTGWSPAKIGPVPSPRAEADDGGGEDLQQVIIRAWNQNARFKWPGFNWLRERGQSASREDIESEGFILGWGARAPTFTLPAGFQQRLGRTTLDFHYSGTYMSEGKRIGFLRVPDFDPPSTTLATRELAGEIAFFRQNTDGMVVDVSRNPGGSCYMHTLASYLIPQRFWFFGLEWRPTADLISGFERSLELYRLLRLPQWTIDLTEFQLKQIRTAYTENRGTTGPIPACDFDFESDPAKDNAGRIIAYEKPLVVLIDEFSTSAADIFPAMMQDNERGLLVGKRTNGAGGTVEDQNVGFYMESSTTNTRGLATRRRPRATQGYPTSHYIENVGVHPDVEIERMTEENLRNNGRPFVDAFTKVLVEEINKAAR